MRTNPEEINAIQKNFCPEMRTNPEENKHQFYQTKKNIGTMLRNAK
jgi:hypothetical protein